jgi:hypothetical protein
MADLVDSPASHLFSRAYISANFADINVLEAMSTHPRIALCVRELIWDVSTKPNRSATRASHSPSVWENVERAQRILFDYGHILERRLDFEALLLAIPRFAGLKDVVFVELMSLWMLGRNVNREYWSSRLIPRPPDFDIFESPAMRQWSALASSVFLHLPITSDEPDSVDTFLSNPRGWVQRMQARSTEFPEAAFNEPGLRSLRAPILFLGAMERFELKLDSYRLDAVSSPLHYRQATPDIFRGFEMTFLTSWDSVMAGLSEGFRSLRRLQLSFDLPSGDPPESNSRPWHQGLYRMLRSAERLEVLHLRSVARAEFQVSNCLPRFSHLKRLVLDSFTVGAQVVEKELLRWSFAVKLQTLHLLHCVFTPADQSSELFLLLLARDVTLNACCPGSSLARDRGEADPCPVSGDDTSESQAVHEIVSDNDSVGDYGSQEGGPPPVPFQDIEFGSDNEDDDKNYFPCTDEMWSDHLDAPFLGEEEEGALEDAYYQYYHDAEERAYDDDFPDDESDILNEIPIARLRADEAHFIPVPREESWELSLCGASWGYDHHALQVSIDALHR